MYLLREHVHTQSDMVTDVWSLHVLTGSEVCNKHAHTTTLILNMLKMHYCAAEIQHTSMPHLKKGHR